MSCNTGCARCCCCGSKQLQEMPGYFEDINDETRAVKETIRWNFDDGIFNGMYFDLIRVPYQDPGGQMSYAATDRVCLLEYRPEGNYSYGGGIPCYGTQYIRTSDLVRSAYGKCCYRLMGGSSGGIIVQAIFFRVVLQPCDIVLNVARCKKTTEACEYVAPEEASNSCAYLATARMKLRVEIQALKFESFTEVPLSELNAACEAVTYPDIEDIPRVISGNWSTSTCVIAYVPITRSRVVSDLRVIPTEIELFLPSDINHKNCCSEWGVPETNGLVPKPEGWNDLYFGCDNESTIEVQLTPGCAGPNCTDPGSGCGLCFNCQSFDNSQTFECRSQRYDFFDTLGDWRFIG
jgi:hypothetical protein